MTALTNSRPIGSPVTISGRVRQCADLLQPGVRLLDIGCGPGWLSEIALDKGYREYVGFDRRISGSAPRQDAVRFVSGSAFRLPFDDGSFDAAASFDLIEELPRHTELAALREAHRVLAPGGRLYLSAPHFNLMHTPLDPVWLLGRHHYRRRAIVTLLTTAGFTIEQFFVAGGPVECFEYFRRWIFGHLFKRTTSTPEWIERLIDREQGKRRRLGQTIFVVARR